MSDVFTAMDSIILTTFGKQITIHYSDDSQLDTLAIISKEQVQVRQFDAIAEEVTILTIASDIQLKRGDQVIIEGGQWEVDRKVKSDGSLSKWNIHAP